MELLELTVGTYIEIYWILASQICIQWSSSIRPPYLNLIVTYDDNKNDGLNLMFKLADLDVRCLDRGTSIYMYCMCQSSNVNMNSLLITSYAVTINHSNHLCYCITIRRATTAGTALIGCTFVWLLPRCLNTLMKWHLFSVQRYKQSFAMYVMSVPWL